MYLSTFEPLEIALLEYMILARAEISFFFFLIACSAQ